MIRDLYIQSEEMNSLVGYTKENFIMDFPALEYNVCDKHSYADNLQNALFGTHHRCEYRRSECFHYDIMAYSKVFYHLELYNQERFIPASTIICQIPLRSRVYTSKTLANETARGYNKVYQEYVKNS